MRHRAGRVRSTPQLVIRRQVEATYLDPDLTRFEARSHVTGTGPNSPSTSAGRISPRPLSTVCSVTNRDFCCWCVWFSCTPCWR
jgi:hypothetical protein